MKKLFLLLVAVITFCLSASAQSRTVSGIVFGAQDNEPLIGATVIGVGSEVGTVTDTDGRFTLSLPDKVKKIKVSYVGMHTKELPISDGEMTITLDNANVLDEVIAVAYGSAKRSAFTGSAAVLDASQIEAVQVTNPLDALKGRVAGVQMNTASGQPGNSETKILIRGISSINAGTEPLIVLDGTPYAGDINNISSQDIETMTVLKDAASNALYGARGANGVILITTKKGKSGEARVTLDAKWGSNSRATSDYDMITSPGQYYELFGQALGAYGVANGVADPLAFANRNLINLLGYQSFTVPNGENMLVDGYKLNPNATLGYLHTNATTGQQYWITPDKWVDHAYKNSLRQEYNMSVSKADDKSNFYASFSYLNNEGIVANSGYERITGRLTADVQAKPWLKVGANMSYTHFEARTTGTDGDASSSGNLFAIANQVAPIYPLFIRDAKGNVMTDANGLTMYDYGDAKTMPTGLSRPVFGNSNALSQNLLDKDKSEGNAFTATGFFEVRFLKDFKFTSNNTVNVNEARSTSVVNPFYGQYATMNGQVYKAHERRIDYSFQQLLTWTRAFGLHNVNVLLGHENYWNKFSYLTANRSNMLLPGNEELDGAVIDGSSSSYVNSYNNEGYFGRVNYDYDSKYFGSVSFRRDASSRFDPKHRWGSFWSLGGAWLISKEEWFQAPWVNTLKIKASYGEQGNDNIGNFRYINMYEIANGGGHPGAIPTTMGNPDITWEKGGNFNAGVEFSLFEDRLSGSIEGFIRKTSDMLFSFPLPGSFGYTSYYANIGDMVNRGFEIDLTGRILTLKDFTWDASINLTWYKNKITKLPDERKTMIVDGVGGYSSGNYFYGEGESLYTWMMPKYAGVDPETGASLWYRKDADGKMVTTDNYSLADDFLCGSALPHTYGGFGTSAAYKGFDFSIDFNFQLGGKAYDSDYALMMSSPYGNTAGYAMHKDILNSWSTDNKGSNIPRLQYGDQYNGSLGSSDRFLISASYLSLSNINFGYTLPSNIVRKAQIEKVRVYLTADNVALWSKRKGFDPRQSISGASTNAFYAPIRTISGGINVVF